jgi:hypothetical protein
LVRAKRALGNQVRGVLRPFGIRLPSRQGTKKFSSGSATRCNVQCERDGAVGSAGGNRGSDCALGSATQGVGATLGRNFPGNPKFWDSGLSSTRRPPTTHENDTHRAIQVKRPLSFSIGQVEKRTHIGGANVECCGMMTSNDRRRCLPILVILSQPHPSNDAARMWQRAWSFCPTGGSLGLRTSEEIEPRLTRLSRTSFETGVS